MMKLTTMEKEKQTLFGMDISLQQEPTLIDKYADVDYFEFVKFALKDVADIDREIEKTHARVERQLAILTSRKYLLNYYDTERWQQLMRSLHKTTKQANKILAYCKRTYPQDTSEAMLAYVQTLAQDTITLAKLSDAFLDRFNDWVVAKLELCPVTDTKARASNQPWYEGYLRRIDYLKNANKAMLFATDAALQKAQKLVAEHGYERGADFTNFPSPSAALQEFLNSYKDKATPD